MSDYGVSIIELKPDISFDPRLGYSIVRQWRGTEYQIDQLATFYEFRGFRVERTANNNGGKCSMRVYFGSQEGWPADQPIIDRWSKRGNDLEKTLWALPHVRKELDKVTNPDDFGQLALFKADVEGFVRGETHTTDIDGKRQPLTIAFILAAADSVGMSRDVIKALIGAFARGEEAFLVSQCVLVRTQIIATNSTIEADETNVDKIFTTDGMKILFPLIPEKIKNQMKPGYWLKKTPTEEQTGSDRITVEYEWWFADFYDRFIYGDPIT
jgi:hypothetical protein